MVSSGQTTLEAGTERTTWWPQVVPVIAGLGAFGVYATLRAFEGANYQWGPYLSPFYSPLIDVHHHYWPFSPALLILCVRQLAIGSCRQVNGHPAHLSSSARDASHARTSGEGTRRQISPRTLWRDHISLCTAERASLFSLLGPYLSGFSVARRNTELLL